MKELIKIITELKAPKDQFNSYGKYRYRSCEDILEATKPLLAKYNVLLTITDDIVLIGDRYYVKATATVTNLDGVSVSASALAREEETKKGMDGSQVTGASSSYARKYALNGLFCIDDTKDSDATNKHEEQPKEQPQPIKDRRYYEESMQKLNDCTTKEHVLALYSNYVNLIPDDCLQAFKDSIKAKHKSL